MLMVYILRKRRPTDLFFWYKERLAQCRLDGAAGGLTKILGRNTS